MQMTLSAEECSMERAAATGTARSPSVEQRVMAGMISCDVAAERSCRRLVTSDTL